MSEELKLCSSCGAIAIPNSKEIERVNCSIPGCYNSEVWREHGFSVRDWNSRPLEDILCKQLEMLIEKVHKIYESRKISDVDYCSMDNAIDDAESYCVEIERIRKEGENAKP